TGSSPRSPTYAVHEVATQIAGAAVGDDGAVLTFLCRPGNPFGDVPEIPETRPLAVDEAYFEYSGGETAVGLIEDGVIVIRTFSKAFALAGARIGYLLADKDTARELYDRQGGARAAARS